MVKKAKPFKSVGKQAKPKKAKSRKAAPMFSVKIRRFASGLEANASPFIRVRDAEEKAQLEKVQ